MTHHENEIGRYAERTVEGRDDHGELEVVTIWIDRQPGAVWRVSRVINARERESPEPRAEEVVFEGYEMHDALRRANEALEADVEASEDNDDHNDGVRPFRESELQRRLERWFFDHK